ncbi:MAG: hypothetical protein HOL16_03815 [Alphaproteobacteria bacterium]|nr:hypothetical protein [Alphaproteobacteria bacterium]
MLRIPNGRDDGFWPCAMVRLAIWHRPQGLPTPAQDSRAIVKFLSALYLPRIPEQSSNS